MKRILVAVLLSLAILSCKTYSVKAVYFSGGFASVSNLKYVCDETWNSNACTTYVKSMANLWSAESSNVYFNYDSTPRRYNGCFTQPVVVRHTTHSDPDLLGEIIPYKTFTCYSATLAEPTDTWVKVGVNIYGQNIHDMADYVGMSESTLLNAIILHELGHVVSVAHPTSSSTIAIMQTALNNFYSLQPYDISSLVAKWGS